AAGREIFRLRKAIRHSHYVPQTGSGLLEGGLDVAQALLGLVGHALADRHRAVVEAGRARDEDPVPIDDGPREADLFFERRAGADESTSHRVFLLPLTEVQRVSLVVLDGELPRAPGSLVHVLHEANTLLLQSLGRGIVGLEIEMEVLAVVDELGRR